MVDKKEGRGVCGQGCGSLGRRVVGGEGWDKIVSRLTLLAGLLIWEGFQIEPTSATW